MSGFSPVSNGNLSQALTAAQLQQLNAIASMAKGSRFFEGKNGGEGFMGSFVDSTTGLTHYVKMLTHNNERKAFPGQNEQQMLDSQKNKNDDVTLGTMSKSLENDLRALAGRVGKENQFENLLKGRKDGFKTLMTRKFVAQVISLIGNAHNELAKSAKQLDALGRSDAISGTRDLFDWKAVAHAGKEKSTDFTSVLKDAKSMATGLRPESGRKTAIAGENHQQSMEAILKNPSPSSGDIKTFIDNLKNNYCPREWVKDLNEGSKTLQKGLPENVNARKFIAGLLEDALKDENVSKSLGMNSLAAAWNSVKSAVRLFSKLPFSKLSESDNVQEQDLKAHFKVLVGVGALPKGSSEFEQKLLKFAGRCARGGLADVVSADIAKGPTSRVRMSVLKMHSSLDNNARGYEAGFDTLLNEFNKEVWPNAGQPQPNVERPRQNVAPQQPKGVNENTKSNESDNVNVKRGAMSGYSDEQLTEMCMTALTKLKAKMSDLSSDMQQAITNEKIFNPDAFKTKTKDVNVNELYKKACKKQIENIDKRLDSLETNIETLRKNIEKKEQALASYSSQKAVVVNGLKLCVEQLVERLNQDSTEWSKLKADEAVKKILSLLPEATGEDIKNEILRSFENNSLSSKEDITKALDALVKRSEEELSRHGVGSSGSGTIPPQHEEEYNALVRSRSDLLTLTAEKNRLVESKNGVQRDLNRFEVQESEVAALKVSIKDIDTMLVPVKDENGIVMKDDKGRDKMGINAKFHSGAGSFSMLKESADYMKFGIQLTELAYGNRIRLDGFEFGKESAAGNKVS